MEEFLRKDNSKFAEHTNDISQNNNYKHNPNFIY